MSLLRSEQDVFDLLDSYSVAHTENQVLVIGLCVTGDKAERNQNIVCVGRLAAADDLSHDVRVDVAVVVDQIEHMSKKEGSYLLARLRDLISRRVLLVVQDDSWTPAEMLSLGYQELTRPSDDARVFLFDPDRFYPQREWNNPSGWANPENFKRYRW